MANSGSRPGRWLVGARWGSRLGMARWHRDALPRGGASPPAGAEQGSAQKAEPGFKLIFVKISN
jgi:hypothetical protein